MRPFILKIIIGIATFISLLTSCERDSLDHKIDFIGDSIVARWDVNQAFPTRLTNNAGVGGSGIQLLEAHSGAFGSENVVVLSGTNDNSMLASDSKRLEYARRFVDAVLKLSSGRIFVFSVLPRDFQGDRKGINADILAYNELLKEMLSKQSRIVFLDVYHSFKDGESIDIRYYSDGLHLNESGYEILNERLRNAL